MVQERVVQPLGARSPVIIDVRIITASHQNLDDRVKQGRFREDLKFRILVADIELPPLRDRAEDIELLVGHFTDHFNQHYKFKPARYFQRRTLDVFRKYSWPGNVRELIRVIENHMIQANETAISPEHLSLKLYQGGSAVGVGGLLLQDFEKKQSFDKQAFILEAIESVGGSKAEAARRLGVTPQHLQYILGGSKSAKNKKFKPEEFET